MKNIIWAISFLVILSSCNQKTLKNTIDKKTEAKTVAKDSGNEAKESNMINEFTTRHVFIAELEKTEYATCMGMTSMCPKECGNSGEFVHFKTVKYIAHLGKGQARQEKMDHYRIQRSDYYKKPLTAPHLNVLKDLKAGDQVKITVEYVYDTTKSVVRTVEHIISIEKV